MLIDQLGAGGGELGRIVCVDVVLLHSAVQFSIWCISIIEFGLLVAVALNIGFTRHERILNLRLLRVSLATRSVRDEKLVLGGGYFYRVTIPTEDVGAGLDQSIVILSGHGVECRYGFVVLLQERIVIVFRTRMGVANHIGRHELPHLRCLTHLFDFVPLGETWRCLRRHEHVLFNVHSHALFLEDYLLNLRVHLFMVRLGLNLPD